MGELPEHIKKTIDDLKQGAIAKLADARADLEMLNRFEQRYGVRLTALVDLGGEIASRTPELTGGAEQAGALAASRGSTNIRPDEYLGLAPLDAAKTYLALIGRAVHIDEICDAVSKGGAAIKGAEWKDALQRSLLRSTADVIKVQEGVFALVRFYTDEQVKRLRSTRRQATPAAKPKRKRGRPPGSKNKKTQGSGATARSAAMKAAPAGESGTLIDGANGASAALEH